MRTTTERPLRRLVTRTFVLNGNVREVAGAGCDGGMLATAEVCGAPSLLGATSKMPLTEPPTAATTEQANANPITSGLFMATEQWFNAATHRWLRRHNLKDGDNGPVSPAGRLAAGDPIRVHGLRTGRRSRTTRA